MKLTPLNFFLIKSTMHANDKYLEKDIVSVNYLIPIVVCFHMHKLQYFAGLFLWLLLPPCKFTLLQQRGFSCVSNVRIQLKCNYIYVVRIHICYVHWCSLSPSFPSSLIYFKTRAIIIHRVLSPYIASSMY